jgi:replicative DNA helicase Mcm
MNKDEVSALNEALEQQTVTVNKATIRATLHARCSLLAAANPKSGKYNINTTLGEQVDIPAPVRTRFALIFIIVDKPKKERDKEIFKTIVNNWRGPKEGNELSPAIWRKYVKEARKINPKLNDPELEEKTWNQYWSMRQDYGNDREQGGGSKIVSARQLEDIIRIAGASARCRMDEKINEQDIDRAIALIRKSVLEAGDQGEIMSGVKAEKRPLIEWVCQVLGDGELDRQSLLRLAESEGYFMTDRDIDTFETRGVLYEPRFGTLKVVKG